MFHNEGIRIWYNVNLSVSKGQFYNDLIEGNGIQILDYGDIM